jgi:hypothetical protein
MDQGGDRYQVPSQKHEQCRLLLRKQVTKASHSLPEVQKQFIAKGILPLGLSLPVSFIKAFEGSYPK